ncbi:DUF3108 domain-containing protein [Brachyspira hyodysenteriae]|uniref:DUF3108 domain-containing protein n=1 Tax=Brachyspira hyodysenteriae TaxID=159 RepID=UPI0022CDCE27|nr:DUF3108 domain-containing protein [Brachyspira hyodysenteriae]MCZ9889352.1 DUF3108 domain-containing protein [Brachyspira hyodysenteriae]
MKKYIFIIMALISNIVFGYNQTFKVGEYIKYDVLAQVPEFNISGKVGMLEAEVLAISNVNGIPAYHLYAHVYTTGAANLLYKVSDIFEAWVSTNDFKPILLKKDTTEGDWTNKESLAFHGNYYLFNDKRTVDEKIEFEGMAFDALSLVFFMRFVDKNIGTFKINWLEGKNVKKDIRFTIENGEELKTKLEINKLSTVRIYEKEKYGTDALIAKDKYNQVPLDVIIAEQKVYGLTIRVRGIIREYKDGK